MARLRRLSSTHAVRFRGAVAVHGLAWQTASSFGGDDDVLFVIFLQLGDQPFAAAVAVNICGIEKVYAAMHGRVQGGHGLFVGNMAPGAADGPRAEADFGNFPTSTA